MTGQPYFLAGDSSPVGVGCVVPLGGSTSMVGFAEGGDAYFVEADDDVGYDDLVGDDGELDADVEEVAGVVNDMFMRAGLRVREWDDDGVAYCEVTIPTPRPIVITAKVALPDEALTRVSGEYDEEDEDEVGRSRRSRRRARRSRRRARIKSFVKKSARTVKRVAKKVAKSKAFKVIAKVAPFVAAVIPGGQALAAGLAVAKVARKVVSAAKKGSSKARGIIKRVANRVRHSRVVSRVKTALKSKIKARLTARSAPARKSRRYTVRKGGRSRVLMFG